MTSILLNLWNINEKSYKMWTIGKNMTQVKKSKRTKCSSNKNFRLLTKIQQNWFSNKKFFFFFKWDNNLEEARSGCMVTRSYDCSSLVVLYVYTYLYIYIYIVFIKS